MKEKNDRLLSIDAARGFDMMFIMGMAGIIVALCKLFPEGGDSWLALQMSHVKWEGFRHHDTIFALFLFLSGMTIPFSIGKKISSGQSKSSIVLNILRRGLTLFVLGMIYGGLLKLEFSSFRIPSVLGRIGVAWMIAALLYVFTEKRFQWITAGTILVGYFILLKFCIAPDAPAGAGTFSLEGNIASYIDRLLIPNHIYKQGIYDPEGIVGTIPAVATALLGLFTGRYVKESGDSGNRKTIVMLVAAAIMIVIKKNGVVEDFDCQKIINACRKAASRALDNLTDDDYIKICTAVMDYIDEEEYDNDEIPVDVIHSIVEHTLLEMYPKSGEAYQQYRNYKKDFVHMMDDVYAKSQGIRYIGDVSNANTDSTMTSTQRSLIYGELNKNL